MDLSATTAPMAGMEHALVMLRSLLIVTRDFLTVLSPLTCLGLLTVILDAPISRL